ncbi:hypothetical protein A0H81_12033 [Grifola frondosa]|uniref:Uncharacterized protein n=1 Tax=Grifola frondosa TaxID=5627 RepID=A0A1C7LU33_GRIFR|nr:hypothetical protein A0H81_12033 [Grifola frondosa]
MPTVARAFARLRSGPTVRRLYICGRWWSQKRAKITFLASPTYVSDLRMARLQRVSGALYIHLWHVLKHMPSAPTILVHVGVGHAVS